MLPTKVIRRSATPEEREYAFRSATVDHLRCQSHDGSSDAYNLAIACQRCNNLRGDIPYEIFYEFARVAMRGQPDGPTHIYKEALGRYILDLATLGMTKQHLVKPLSSLAQLRVETALAGQPMGYRSRPQTRE